MDWRKLGMKLLFPPVWLLLLLTMASAVLLTMVFLRGMETSAAAYVSYVLSFYTLVTVCAFCIVKLPGRLRGLREKFRASAFGSRWSSDGQFRMKLSLNVSLWINVLHIAMQVLQWYLLRSWWFVVLAAYYSILSLMRFLLAWYVDGHELGSSILAEWKRSRTCACILLLVNLSLSGAVLMILFQNRGFTYNGILIYVIALYTFYSVIHAVVETVKYRALTSPVLSTSKIVSLCAALVSLLNLETAMFAQFGADMDPETQRIFIILTGAGVSAVVVGLSVMLILRAAKEIRREIYGK